MSGAGEVDVDRVRLMLIVAALRELMRAEPGPHGRNAFRLEDWSEWPDHWRTAYEVLGRAVVASGRTDEGAAPV